MPVFTGVDMHLSFKQIAVRFLDSLTVTCMWRSRLRATFLSSRDEVDADDKPTITHKTGYDTYRLLPAGFYFLS